MWIHVEKELASCDRYIYVVSPIAVTAIVAVRIIFVELLDKGFTRNIPLSNLSTSKN
nr:MAG TPA: hypothetical protein [Caudoviricetes sp.]